MHFFFDNVSSQKKGEYVMEQIEELKQQIEQLQNESTMQTEYLFHGELGNFYFAQRDLELADKFYSKTLEIARSMHNRSGEAATLGNLGMVYTEQGDTERAITLYEEALKIARELGERQLEGNTLSNSGLAYGQRGDRDRAQECYHGAFTIARELGDQELLENVLSNLQLLPGAQTSKRQIDTAEQERFAQDNTDTSDVQRSTGTLTLLISRKSLYLFAACMSILALIGAIILVFYLQGVVSFVWSTPLSGLLSGSSLALSFSLWLFLWRFSNELSSNDQRNRAR
jgi:tetratricopeptide (TPR) repeat protein